MNSFFRDAVITRLCWVDVVAFEGQADCLAETRTAIEAAYDAVRDLAFSAAQKGTVVDGKPHILADVPALAEHFRVGYQACREVQYLSRHGGATSRLASNWLGKSSVAVTPYSRWLTEVTVHLSDLAALPCSHASIATRDRIC